MAKYKLTEKELGDILRTYQEMKLQEVSATDEIDVEVTEKSKKRVKRLMRRVQKPYYRFTMSSMRIAATAAVAVVVLLAATFLTIEPLRKTISDIFRDNANNVRFIHVDNDVANAHQPRSAEAPKGYGFIRTDHATLTSYQVDPNDIANTPQSIVDQYTVAIEASDYVIIQKENNDDHLFTYFRQKTTQHEILITQATKQFFIAEIELADEQISDIALKNGMIGLSVTGINGIYLLLQNDDYAFLVESTGDVDELMRFAETLSPETK